jgi:hypothetical protein
MGNMKVRITIGDWSEDEDGHNQYEEFVFDSNKSVTKIQDAYKQSCKTTGLQFNHNENYSGLKEHDDYETDRHICTEYEESYLSETAVNILEEHGVNPRVDENNYIDVNDFCELVIDFIKISLPDLTLEEASFKKSELRTIPAVNGWWNNTLNIQIGYGLFE